MLKSPASWLIAALLALAAAFWLNGGARADHDQIQLSVACPFAQIADAAEKFKTETPRVADGCLRFPLQMPPADIKRVVSGPHIDHEGAEFYVVEVDLGDDGEWFALAWPGVNTNLKKQTDEA